MVVMDPYEGHILVGLVDESYKMSMGRSTLRRKRLLGRKKFTSGFSSRAALSATTVAYAKVRVTALVKFNL